MRPSRHTTFSYSAIADGLRHAALDLPRGEHRMNHLADFLQRDKIVTRASKVTVSTATSATYTAQA